MQEQENTNGEGQTQSSLFRAAEYVRMSTEHQQYSTENQADKIREYAAHRGIEIIKTYADAGKSGLRIDGLANLRFDARQFCSCKHASKPLPMARA